MERINACLIAYLLFGVVFCSNCQTVEYVGRYVGGESYETRYELRLYKNGSFQYVLKEGLACDTILGVWDVVENKIIVLRPEKFESYHIELDCDTCSGVFYIKTYSLHEDDKLNYPDVCVYSKGGVIAEGITNSIEHVVMQKADSIQINYVGFESYVFIPQKRYNTVAEVYLIEEKQMFLQIDITLKIRKNKLVTESGMKLKKQF